jgi:lipopolysaccharide export system permease protein
MLIIDRALMRETLQTSFAVTFIFVSLFVVVTLVSSLGKAAVGEVPAGIVFTLLGLQTVKVIGLLLPLALFVGILLTLGRWYRDSEMAVLSACGISLMHFVRPVLLLATGFALIAALFAFYLGPLSSSLITRLKTDDTSRYEAAGVVPGVFNDVRYGKGTYYVEQINKDESSLTNIFVSTDQLGKEGVLLAKSGYHYTNKQSGDRFLMLKNGTRYEGVPGQADYRILDFETYSLRVEPPPARDPLVRFEALTTPQLLGIEGETYAKGEALGPIWRQGVAAEWHWRLSKPVTMFLLALLALVFSYTHPRRGRYGGLFIAILVYFIYTNLLGVSDALLKQGRIPLVLGMWWVHASFFALAVYLLIRRSNNKSLIPLPGFLHR